MTRALVVDDSQFMRTVISDALEDHGYGVVTAINGKKAIEAVDEHDPDVITMDVNMPEMDGIEATKCIMKERPTPILMLSAHTDDGADATLEALGHGAVDFLTKPDGEVSVDTVSLRDQLQEKIDAVAAVDVSSLPSTTPVSESDANASEGTVDETDIGAFDIPTPEITDVEVDSPTEEGAYLDNPTIVIGASTGGPKMIETILSALPLELEARVLIVQHMPKDFTDRFAKRLDSISAYDVREATDGDYIGGGEALVARGGEHLDVTSYAPRRLCVETAAAEDPREICPAIDRTMKTAAEMVTDPLVGIVLTGMGRDGVEGMEAIKDAGGTTLAQNEASSPVFGIPKQAIESGSVDSVLPADRMADGILDALRSKEVDDNG